MRFNLRFEDDELDREFVVDNNEKAARQGAPAFAFGSIGYGLLGLVVFLIDQVYFAKIAWFVYAFVVPTHLSAAFITRRLGKIYLFQWLLVFANTFSAFCLAVMLYHAPSYLAITYGYGLITSINLYCFALLRMRFFFATVGSVISTSMYFAVMILQFDVPQNDYLMIISLILFINTAGLAATWFFESFNRHEFMQSRIIARQRREIEEAKQKSEDLLLNILPREVAERLLSGETTIADLHKNVSVLFADIEGFTGLSRRLKPEALVSLLNEIFSHFDEAAARHGLEKIKTIGDAYMAAAGLPQPTEDHARRCVAMAVDMLNTMSEINRRMGEELRLRIGISSGPVIAGVIGRNKFIFDLWGDTVNIASRMESSGLPGEVHITESTLKELGGHYETSPRDEIEVKGLGRMQTYLVKL